MYIGTIPTPAATESRQEFTCTAGQTTFNTTGGTTGYIDCFLNGVKLDSRSDFTFDGSVVTLTTGAAAGDILAVIMRQADNALVALPIKDSAGNNVIHETGGVVQFPAGHIVQTVSSSFNGVQTIGTSDTDITDLNCSMTIASGNKVLILVSLYTGQGPDDYGIFRIVDGSNTAIYQNSTGTGNQSNASMVLTAFNITNDQHMVVSQSLNFLWTPGVTAINVKVNGRCSFGSNIYINRSENTANAGYANRATSHLTIMEVAA